MAIANAAGKARVGIIKPSHINKRLRPRNSSMSAPVASQVSRDLETISKGR